jgi:membrane protein DedA with SNARE-associated domain
MITTIINALTVFIIHVISQAGYAGVAGLMAIESAAIPLPSEVIMPFAGYLAGEGRFNLFWLAIAGGLGSAAGSAITYWIGRYGGRPLIERYGKYLLISRHDLDLADNFFARFGALSTFIGRLLPVVRTFISIPAGIARVRFLPFILYSFIGSVLWSLLLAYFGFRLGSEWMQLREKIHGVDYAIAALIVIAAVWWVWRHFRSRPA